MVNLFTSFARSGTLLFRVINAIVYYSLKYGNKISHYFFMLNFTIGIPPKRKHKIWKNMYILVWEYVLYITCGFIIPKTVLFFYFVFGFLKSEKSYWAWCEISKSSSTCLRMPFLHSLHTPFMVFRVTGLVDSLTLLWGLYLGYTNDQQANHWWNRMTFDVDVLY